MRSEGRGKWRGGVRPLQTNGSLLPMKVSLCHLQHSDELTAISHPTDAQPLCPSSSLSHSLMFFIPPSSSVFMSATPLLRHPKLFRSLLTYTNSALIKLTYSCLPMLHGVKTVHRVPYEGRNMLTAACGREKYKMEVGQSHMLAG